MGNEYQSEMELENQLIRRLKTIGYAQVQIPDEEALLAHFRDLLNQRNADNLAGTPLSDHEFNAALNQLIGSRTHYQIAQQLRGGDTQPKGKINIQRDDNSQLYLEVFDGTAAANNVFEVTHQTTFAGVHENRYDVLILVNGLPLAQVELKRRGVEFKQAFNQIIRYKSEMISSGRDLRRLIQLFVISNGNETRYFANGDGKLNSNFMFYWTDEDNHWLNDLDAFTCSFFAKERFHSIIARYTIFDKANELMMVMRPYQIYATEAIIKQAEDTNDNGYVWHTTGSGKTITSFKASRLLAQDTNVEKVIFMIDRADLDIQTAKNFEAYLPETANGEAALDRTNNTEALVKQLSSNGNQLIVTTIQKMNSALRNDRYKAVLTPYHDRKVAFIEDEAHRSQFGDMRKNVNHWFKNAQHFGFTGTPIFPENIGADGRTTKDIYHKLLHKYLIKDAIRDGNVLGFTIQYINTIQGKGIADDDEQVSSIDKREVFEDENRLRMITSHIIANHGKVSKGKLYNAVFTVPNTRVALKYYHLFKELDTKHRLNVTTIFTWAANEDDNEEHQGQDDVTSRQGLDEVISDYNDTYGTDFSTDHFKDYFADVSKRMKEHNADAPGENIDILIVVNMFLTGFDSKKLSTLYVDRNLRYHTLIQAFSRTNRVETASKPSGNIIAYRNLKQNTDDAVKLFSGGDNDDFFAPSYDKLKGEMLDAITKLREVTPTVASVDALYNQGTEAISRFVLAFREVLRSFNKIRVYDDFEWQQFAPAFSEQDLEDYRGKYYTAYSKLTKDASSIKGSILDDIDFEIQLVQTDTIDVAYIVNLIKNIDLDTTANRDADTKKIRRILHNADNDDLKSKAELLERFLDEVIPKLPQKADIGNALDRFMAHSRDIAIDSFAKENGLPPAMVTDQINDYSFYGHTSESKMTDQLNEVGLTFMQKRTMKQKIGNFVTKTLKAFSFN
jgi:type I restriction enzyme R subunit